MRGSSHKLRIHPVADYAGRRRYTISLQVDLATQAHLVSELDKLALALPTTTGEGAAASVGYGADGGRRKTRFARVMEGTLRPSLALISSTPLSRIACNMERTISRCCRLDPATRL